MSAARLWRLNDPHFLFLGLIWFLILFVVGLKRVWLQNFSDLLEVSLATVLGLHVQHVGFMSFVIRESLEEQHENQCKASCVRISAAWSAGNARHAPITIKQRNGSWTLGIKCSWDDRQKHLITTHGCITHALLCWLHKSIFKLNF